MYSLQPEGLAEVTGWISELTSFWETQLGAFKRRYRSRRRQPTARPLSASARVDFRSCGHPSCHGCADCAQHPGPHP
jgi:hypothetical protein